MNKIRLILGGILFAVGLITCNHKMTVKPQDKERLYAYIENYIDSVSKFEDYKALQKQFYCFYQNAIKFKRESYFARIDSQGEKSIGLDSLVIFNRTKDTALLMYIEKVHNYESEGYHFRTPKLIAYKNNNQWRFYDNCENPIYLDSRYTLEMARNNERLWFALDGGWLLDWKSDRKIRENKNFVSSCLKMLCGLQDKSVWGTDTAFYADILRKQTPPDSLYICE